MRESVLAAASGLLEEEGLAAVTIRAIAARSGVAPMSVYNHFGDKQGVLTAVAQERFAELARELSGITEPDAHRRLRRAGSILRALMTAHPRSYELMWSTPAGPATRDAFTQLVHLVQYGQASGAFIDADPVALASAVWAAIHGAITVSYATSAQQRPEAGDRVSLVDYTMVLNIVDRGITA